jgi:hypothetical protein
VSPQALESNVNEEVGLKATLLDEITARIDKVPPTYQEWGSERTVAFKKAVHAARAITKFSTLERVQNANKALAEFWGAAWK